MTKRSDMVGEVERALSRASEKAASGRYAVYIPGAVVIGTYKKEAEAHDVATRWTAVVPDVVVVDRGTDTAIGPPKTAVAASRGPR